MDFPQASAENGGSMTITGFMVTKELKRHTRQQHDLTTS